MEKEIFSPMAIDALGEMMNISLGSSATAVSNMLNHRVDITTPKVTVVPTAEFSLGNLDPALGVEIKYVEGLDGSNIMLLKRSDVKVIVDILMGMETPDEEFELNELSISAVCEVMNQMMGAAATAMSDFLGYPVNISTPEPFELNDVDQFKSSHYPDEPYIVVVRFKLSIEEALESEFVYMMSVPLAKRLLKGLGLEMDDEEEEAAPAPTAAAAPTPPPPPPPAKEEPPAAASSSGGGDHKMSQEEIERMLAGGFSDPEPEPEPAPAPAPTPAAAPAPAPAPAPQPTAAAPQSPPPPPPEGYGYPPYGQQPVYGQPPAYGQQPVYSNQQPVYAQPMYAPPQPKVVNSQPMAMQQLDLTETLGKEQAQNLDLIMGVPLQVTVEIGRTKRKVQEILSYSKGSLVVLDKLAGDQVDLFVNGKCIARGDVVVIEDNFGVRITEILQKPGVEDIIQK
jgi:flagellar motor switch protein FliN/FliY